MKYLQWKLTYNLYVNLKQVNTVSFDQGDSYFDVLLGQKAKKERVLCMRVRILKISKIWSSGTVVEGKTRKYLNHFFLLPILKFLANKSWKFQWITEAWLIFFLSREGHLSDGLQGRETLIRKKNLLSFIFKLSHLVTHFTLVNELALTSKEEFQFNREIFWS